MVPSLLAAASLAILAAGCGGEETESSSTAAEPRGYEETGEAISDVCRAANADVRAVAVDLTGEAKKDAPLIRKIADDNEGNVGDLKAIVPHPKLKPAFDEYVKEIEAAQARTREVQAIAESGDSEAYRMAVEALNADESKTNRLERALGAVACVEKD